MNTIFWLVFFFILARSIWRLMERAGANGKFEGPLGGLPPTGMGRPMPGSEERPKLKIPEYLTRRSEEQPAESAAKRKGAEPDTAREYSEPVASAGEIAEPSIKGQPSGLCPEGSLAGTEVKTPCGMEGQKGPHRKRRELGYQGDLLSDMLCPDQVVKGMAWSMILGPRGGLRSKR